MLKKIERQVSVSYRDLIHVDFDGFLDLLSNEAIGTEYLMDINYELIGREGDLLLFNVTGETDSLCVY